MTSLLLSLLLVACGSNVPASTGEPAIGNMPAAVERVVVLELQEACDCTRTRQQVSRAAFEAETAKRSTPLAVTLIHMDTDAERAREYQDLKEPVVSPAYYFLDASGLLVTFLQGEITAEQFQAALGEP